MRVERSAFDRVLWGVAVASLIAACGPRHTPDSVDSAPVITDLEVVPGRSAETGQGIYLAMKAESPGRNLPLSYEWSVVSAPDSARFELNQFGDTANFTARTAGDYRLSVRVTDRVGRVETSDVPVQVADSRTHPEGRPTPRGELTQRPCRDGDESLEQFSARCDKAMGGVSVPAFDCDGSNATEPRLQEVTNGKCGAPNVLNHECDPGSHFQVLHRDENGDGIYIVAHCRKLAHDGNGDGEYGDVAVIQYNSKTGATCFYQALRTGLPHDAPAPIGGDTSYWLKPGGPNSTSSINCVRCHDTGPFVRSPYLAQLGQVWPFSGDENNPNNPNAPDLPVADANYLPGTLDDETYGPWNSSMPYMFVGLNFQSWEAYSVTNTAHPTCTTCHRMGASRSGGSWNVGSGTSMNLGILATDPSQAMKVDHGTLKPGEASPIWMRPGQADYDAAIAAHADAMKTCAESITQGEADDGCGAARFAQGDTCPPPNVVVNGATTPVDTTSWQSSGKQPLGQPGGRVGFYYFTSIHGPFYQNSPWDPYMNAPPAIADPPWDPPSNAPDFRGTYLRIYSEPGGQWMVAWGMDANDIKNNTNNPPPPGGPGGEIAGVAFDQIDSVPEPDHCGSGYHSITDQTGSHPVSTTVIDDPAGEGAAILAGLIGNVSRRTVDPPTAALVGVRDAGGQTILGQTHTSGPALKQWFTAESWANRCGDWQASAHFAAHSVQSTNDVLLVPTADVPHTICYIDGIAGDWAQWRSDGQGGLVVPFAQIYIDPSSGYRLKVGPNSTQHNAVSAFATCLYLKH